MSARVLVVGGGGYFGRLLIEELLELEGVEVMAAGRRSGPLEALRAGLGPDVASRLSIAVLDLASPADVGAAVVGADVAVCAAGPFQALPQTLLEACLEGRVPYIDVSDDRSFCRQVRARVAAAEDPIAVATGWSATPALTGALTRALVEDWDAVDRLDLSIAPGNRMPRAHGTVASLLDSLGRRFEVWRDGAWTPVTGWSDGEVFPYPDPIGPRRGWLVDVPSHDDHEAAFGARTIEFRVGAEIGFLNASTSLLAWMVRKGWVANWSKFTPLLRRGMAAFGWLGTDHGAVGVAAAGRRGGRAVRGVASIVAEARAPRIPVMPAVLAVRAIAEGRPLPRGLNCPYRWIGSTDLRAACEQRGYGLLVKTEEET